MYKLLVILFIIRLYARFKVFMLKCMLENDVFVNVKLNKINN